MGVLLLGRVLELPAESLRRAALLDAKNSLPTTTLALPRENLVIVLAEATLDRDGGRMVAVEESRVNLDTLDGARGDSQTNHNPVELGGVVSPCLPTVVPRTGINHLSGLADRGRRGDEVGRFGEPFVRETENFATESSRDKIYIPFQLALVESVGCYVS